MFEIFVIKRIYEIEIRYTAYDSEIKLIGFGPYGKKSIYTYLISSSTPLENVTITAERKE